MVENQNDRNIKTLWSDNGGEVTLEEFKELYREFRIKRKWSTPENSQQNGVAEKKNQTIMEAAKAMLHDQDIPMHLWMKEARITMYVQNHTPRRVLNNKTPEEAFLGEKPEVIHKRIFGFSVYIDIPKEKRTKIDPSGRKGIIIGYSDTSNSYQYTSQDSRRSTSVEM